MKTKIIIFLLLCNTLTTVFAQDVIIKKDGEKLLVIIKEVHKNSIKYVDYKDPNGVIFTIDKVLVREVKFSYGKNLNVKNPEKNPLYFADDQVGNIMLNFSGIGRNSLGISYERALKIGQSIMIEGNIYGIGIKSENEISRSGFGLDFSYRLKTKSLFNKESYRPKHILHGSYFAPIIGFSTGTTTYENYYSDNQTIDHSIVHIGLQYGKQWVLQRKVTIDWSFGFHYYFGKDTSEGGYNNTLELGNMTGNENKLVSFNLRVGFLTGKKRSFKK